MNDELKWTNLNRPQIARALTHEGYEVSVNIVDQLLIENDFHKRRASRCLTAKQCKNRDEQFQLINKLKDTFFDADNPVLSMDAKKKEYLGRFYREGTLYTKEQQKVLDHDFDYLADGVIIPHGIYDIFSNEAYINLGTTHDTSEFACESLYRWWTQYGSDRYAHATEILILCDGGGSNSSSSYLFKQDLLKLAHAIAKPIRIAHYPPYTSKYNPIEHRVFCHITRAWKGVIFEDIQVVKELTQKASTAQGLKVTCDILNGQFKIGRKFDPQFKANLESHVELHESLPDWNYRIPCS